MIIKAEKALCSEDFNGEGLRGRDSVPLCVISNVEMKTVLSLYKRGAECLGS